MIKVDAKWDGIDNLVFSLNDLANNSVDKELMSQVGAYVMLQIKTRTLAGKDVSGNAFVPYSSDYAFFRDETGHDTSNVNLFFRGHMLAAMDANADDTSVEIYFNDAQQAAKAHGHNYGSAKTGLPQREFFALSEDDVEKIKDMIGDHAMEAFNGR